MHLPRSSRNWSPLLLIGPNVSMATGTQVYDWASCAYLVVFLQPQEVPSDNSDVAADRNKPVFLDVPSHASAILARNYCPSGRFPSNGSLVTVMCAVDRPGRWSYDVERPMSPMKSPGIYLCPTWTLVGFSNVGTKHTTATCTVLSSKCSRSLKVETFAAF